MKVVEYGKGNKDIIILLHGGGLSLGGQVLIEMLSQRSDICEYAIIESALVIPMKYISAMIKPAYDICYPLVKKRWFSKIQFKALHIRKELFDKYIFLFLHK